jgi:hypothetical protein
VSASANSSHGPTAIPGVQPFPPGFEGLDFDQICRRGPAAARFVALLAWADRVPRDGLADAVNSIRGRASDEWALESSMALSMLMARWGEKDPAHARQVLEEDRSAKRLSYWGWPALLGGMARSDPALARQTFAEAPLLFSEPGAAALWTEFGIALTADDPQAALDWAETLPGQQRTTALASLMRSGKFSSIEAAESLLPILSLPSVRSALHERWSRDDPAAAAEWFKPHYRGREDVLIERWASDDPAAAAAWTTQNLDAEAMAKAGPALAARYADRDPVAAAQWIEGLPEGAPRTESIKAAVSSWGDAAALQWALTLPRPEEREAGVLAYNDACAQRGAYAEALNALTGDHVDAERRLKRLQSTYLQWMDRNAAMATSWLDRSTLSFFEKSVLRTWTQAVQEAEATKEKP